MDLKDHQNSTNPSSDNNSRKLSSQNLQNMTNSTISVEFVDGVGGCGGSDIGNGSKKVIRRRSSVSINQLGTTHYEHRVSMPFSSTPHAVFKKGKVVRGILCPSLTNSFR